MQKMRLLGLTLLIGMLAGSTALRAMDPNAGPDTSAPAPAVHQPEAPKKPSVVKNMLNSFTQSSKAKWGLGGALFLGLFGFVHRTNIFHGRKLTQPILDGGKKWFENIKKGDTGTIIGTIGVGAALGTTAYFMWGSSSDVSGSAGLKGIRGKSEDYWREWNLQQALEERIDSASYPALMSRLKLAAEKAQTERDANTDPSKTVALAEAYTKANQEYLTAATGDTAQPFVDKCAAVVAHLQAYKQKVDALVEAKGAALDSALDKKAAQFVAKDAAKKAAEAAKTTGGK